MAALDIHEASDIADWRIYIIVGIYLGLTNELVASPTRPIFFFLRGLLCGFILGGFQWMFSMAAFFILNVYEIYVMEADQFARAHKWTASED